MERGTPFLTWLSKTQPFRLVFIHVFVVCASASMITLGADTLVDAAIAWTLIIGAPIGYWVGNYWYWRVFLKKGTRH